MSDSVRICTGCKVEKLLTEFKKDKRGPLGYAHRCRACCNACDTNTPDKIARKRQRNRERERQRAARKKAFSVPDPVKRRARHLIGAAVERGEVARPTFCSDCGQPCRTEAHHVDYSRPFDVEWLCTGCHGKRHRKEIAT